MSDYQKFKDRGAVVGDQQLYKPLPGGNEDSQKQPVAPENYNLSFLTSEKKSSYQFLEESAYFVPLKQLYKVVDTCTYHQGMVFCPVLVEIQEAIKGHFKSYNYMLQVWNLDGNKVFQSELNHRVTRWSICNQYFIYKPEGNDTNSEFFHIVDLKNQNATILIKDVEIQDPTDLPYQFYAYYKEALYLANSNHIKVIKVPHNLSPQETREITDLNNSMIIQIGDGENNKIHGLYIHEEKGHHEELLVAIETKDHQIDFNSLEVGSSNSIQKDGEASYSLKQLKEVVEKRRNTQDKDQIVKFETIINRHQEIYSIAMRKSGGFDLYYNGARVSSNHAKVLVDDVQLTFDKIFLLMREPYVDKSKKPEEGQKVLKEGKKEVRIISMAEKSRIHFDLSEKDSKAKLAANFYMRIKNHCKLFRSFSLTKSYVLVAHSHMLSIFNVIGEIWFQHKSFDSDISQLIRQNNNNGKHELLFLLQNGQLTKAEMKKNDHWNCNVIPNQVVEGDVLHVSKDKQGDKFVMILTKIDEQTPRLYLLYDSILHNATGLFDNLTIKHRFCFLFSMEDHAQFVLQEKDQFTLCDLSIVHKQENQEHKEGEENHKKENVHQIGDMELKLHKPFTLDFKDVSIGKIHSGLIKKKKDNKWMLLMDYKHFYIIDMISGEKKLLKNQNCIGMFFIDNNYMYSLCHKTDKRLAGFKLYDVLNVFKTGKDYCYPLSSVLVGCQSHIDYSRSNERLVFQSSFEAIELVPILHRNTLKFIGMKKRDTYLTQRQFFDRFTVLEAKKQKLTTWDILTGKVTSEIADLSMEGYNLSEYEQYKGCKDDHVYRASWYTKTLIKKIVPETDSKAHIEGDKPLLKNQESFIHRMNKQFYEFKLIEITSETTVKEHLKFVHPIANNGGQFLYISDDCKHMIEKQDDRVFLYESTPVDGDQNKVKWKMVHRFTNFPSDLMEKTQNPFIFTPDFTQYLDLDRKNHIFVVRDSHTQERIGQIPPHLMDAKLEDPLYVANRFQWLSNNQFRLVNKEGCERILNIKFPNKLESDDHTLGETEVTEEQFNYIPLYNDKACHKHHILVDPSHLKLKDTDKRLVRKYQTYKSLSNLFGETNKDQVYKSLFSVDYGLKNYNDTFLADLSFTFFHWNLIELTQKGKLSTNQIDVEHIQDLCYNILPEGNTLVHQLCSRADILEYIYSVCHPIKDDKVTIHYHIPFIRNLQQKSPFNVLEAEGKEDYRTMNMILKYLSAYDADHHSRQIVDSLPVCIEHNLPQLNNYLDSRILQTASCRQLTKGLLVDVEPLITASFWMDPTDSKKLFKKAPIEQDIRLQFIDIPSVHTFTEEISQEFFSQLSQTEDMSIFERKAIQKLIDFKWPLILEYTVYKLFIPYLAFLGTYLIYMGYIFQSRDDSDTLYYLNHIFEAFLLIQVVYFLSIEIRQCYNQGVEYFTSVWNYLDIVPPLFILLFVTFELAELFDIKRLEFDVEESVDLERKKENEALLHKARTIQAVLAATCTLMLWLKMLYFLRIFEKTGYLVRIIIEVVVDMRHFLFILILSIIAFGDALLQISKANPLKREGDESDPQFIEGGFVTAIIYTYRLVLGDWDTSNFGRIASSYAMILFLLCTIFNLVIMLNLLIAIISESFARINEVSEQANYQEKSSMIYENSYLIPEERKAAYCAPNKYLLMAIDIDQEMEDQNEDIDFKLRNLKKKLYNSIDKCTDKIKDKLKKQKKAQKKVNEKLVTMVTSIQEKLDAK